MNKKIPIKLQPFFCSVKIKDLSLEEDKVYIINQVLALGGLKELKWLFKVYPKRIIKNIFLSHPIKIFRPATFYFTKDILFGLEKLNFKKEKYVINTPRIIRQRKKSCF